MAFDFSIAQVLVVADPEGPRVVAQSAGFPFAWEEAAKLAVVRFGSPPADRAVSASIFALPVGRTHVAVVQMAWPSFRFLILGKPVYDVLGDPFAIADSYPPDWSSRGEIPTLEWPKEPLPVRTVAMLQELTQAGDGPFLYGATQALLDGRKIVLKRSETSDAAIRTIWKLLPGRIRCELWPATLAFSDDLGFDICAMPEIPAKLPPDGLGEEQAKDYPEGRYELALQSAIESGDQPEVDRLFARRTSSEVLRTAAILVGGILLIALGMKLLGML